MTREEAINSLESIRDTYLNGHGTKENYDMTLDSSDIDAIIVAISVLFENAGDLISRQAVENITWEEPSYSDPLNVLTEVREKVRALPSVENKGEWIRTRTWEHDGEPYCSICGFAPYDEGDCGNFCPNCGAKMKGDEQMKKERAIEILEHELKWGRNDDGVAGIHDGTTLDALEMAISALKESKERGKWIDSSNGWTCSICNRDSKSDTDFCPNCGTKMKGGGE